MPQRFLRPQLTTSERWNSVSFKAQSLWIRLMNQVDDFGRFDGRPTVIWGTCFSVWNDLNKADPVSAQEVEELCNELIASKLISVYDVNGKRVVQMEQWTERARTDKSRWPDRPQHSAALSCAFLPPSPSSSPSPSTAPSVVCPEVELPTGFPKTPDDAIARSASIGCDVLFTTTCWNKAMGRGGRDAKDVPIRNFASWLAAEWSYAQSRKNETRKSNSRSSGSRSQGTLNEGTASDYAQG